MISIFKSLSVFLALVHFSQQAVINDKRDYYVGAVVDFTPTFEQADGPRTILGNAKTYLNFVKQAKERGADIIVFPEDGLTSPAMPDNKWGMEPWSTVIPSASENFVPCTQNRTGMTNALKLLSCAARDNRIYVVVNIAEKGQKDANSDPQYHNTNVVFDRMGKIIARYRKVNLFGEHQFNTIHPPEVVTFDTDFGVKFGTFICFDILFSIPGLNLTTLHDVRDFVYPTAWGNEGPLLTAVQTQFGWAYAHDVNFLGSGYNYPRYTSTGSGIYLGRDGIADAVMAHDNGHTLLVAKVPKKKPRKQNSNDGNTWEGIDDSPPEKPSPKCYYTLNLAGIVEGVLVKRDNFTKYENAPINGPAFDKTICHNGFCCDFHARRTTVNSPVNYRAVVYNGCRFYGITSANVRVCSIVQCLDNTLESCGYIQPSNTTFTELNVTAKYDHYANTQSFPTVLNTTLLPSEHSWSFNETKRNGKKIATISLKKPMKNLAGFGIYNFKY